MKKRFILLVIAAALLLVSCTSISMPGYQSGLTATLEVKQYDVLGEVVKEGTMHSILGLYTWGGAKYNDLFKLAKKRYDADDVINISIDYDYTAYFGVYISKSYIIRGLAIKYKD